MIYSYFVKIITIFYSYFVNFLELNTINLNKMF